jgi:protocatechuate 3,4-dioxygenase beta subunit
MTLMLFLRKQHDRPHPHDDDHDDMGGLHRDLASTGSAIGRADFLRYTLGAGALALFGCGSTLDGITGAGTDTTTGTGACSKIPEETAGPFPGDGSNGANVLNQTGVVRQDIRPSFAGLSGSATGVPLTIQLTLVSATTCTPLANRAVYLWHCDALGRYSLYSSGVTNQNYLRGVQEADANGQVSFTSIFPGCYAGRWPHIHFEVYPSVSAATKVSNKIATSQIALPKATCDQVYAQNGYSGSASNLSRISLATDGIFSDGSALELATVTGSVGTGLVAALTVAV